MRVLCALVAALLFGEVSACAASERPSPLLIDGKTINVMCLYNLDINERPPSAWVDTRKCEANDIKVGRQITAEGMIGFEYNDADGGQGMSQPYFSYRYIGKFHGRPLIFVESSGGGTGQFTSLVALEFGNHAIRAVENIAGGDRCNGGVSSVGISNGRLHYDQDITPFDVIGLGSTTQKIDAIVTLQDGRKVSLRAYKDLEDSASSCVATVHNLNQKWTSVSLSQRDWKDETGWTERYAYQACFNRVYRDFVARGEVDLDQTGVVRLANEFAKSCLASK
jgi:hypothetical protein